jgi:hypothetical protein
LMEIRPGLPRFRNSVILAVSNMRRRAGCLASSKCTGQARILRWGTSAQRGTKPWSANCEGCCCSMGALLAAAVAAIVNEHVLAAAVSHRLVGATIRSQTFVHTHTQQMESECAHTHTHMRPLNILH